MPLSQTFTIFRTEKIKRRAADGTLTPDTLVSAYPGFGARAREALDSVMEDIAENESDELQDIPVDDPDYDHVLTLAIENLSGRWEVFPGALKARPDATPAAIDESFV